MDERQGPRWGFMEHRTGRRQGAQESDLLPSVGQKNTFPCIHRTHNVELTLCGWLFLRQSEELSRT